MKHIIASLMAVLCFIGCATNTADPKANQRNAVINQLGKEAVGVLGQVAFNTLANVAQSEMTGSKVDFGHSAAQAAWSVTPSIISSATVERVIAAGSAQKLLDTAKMAATVYQQAAPVTPSQKAAVVTAIADTISVVALKKS